MKRILLIALFSLITPLLTLAQTPPVTSGGQQTAQGFIQNFVLFLNGTIVPFMLGIAFVIFVINVIRFFVFQSDNEDGQKAAKALALYSILAFVIIIIFWGVVNLLTSSFGLTTRTAPTSDYVNQDRPAGATPTTGGGTTPPPSGCTAIQRDFDNEFGGPCATTPPANSNNPTPGGFTPPNDAPVQPPPISDELEGAPDPYADPFLQGGPGQVQFEL